MQGPSREEIIMVRKGIVTFAVTALTLGLGASVTAQTTDRSGWWSPVVLQATGDPGGSILRDAVLGRAPSGDVSRGPQQARNQGNVRTGGSNARASNARNGNGPPFCRNGQGHPVHGRRWCEDKGWVGNTSWARAGGWGDVIFGRRAPTRETRVTEPTLGGILGDVVLGRVARFGRDAGLSGSLDGRWTPLASGGSVLQLRMGGVPLAELADLNRDGRADVVLLNHGY
jgi:hypothetical protein